MEGLHEKVRKFDFWDIPLIKLSVVAFVFIILKLIPAVSVWLSKVNIWWFVLGFAVFAVRPFIRFFKN